MECTVDKPPSELDLVQANLKYPQVKDIWEARFLLMYDAYLGQTSNLEDCDLSKSSLRSWNTRHMELKNDTRRITE